MRKKKRNTVLGCKSLFAGCAMCLEIRKHSIDDGCDIYEMLQEIIALLYEFEKIYSFQDGNGRVGRLIMFKKCLRTGIFDRYQPGGTGQV